MSSAILAIETATGPCSVAIWKNGRIAAYLEDKGPATQSAVLMPMVERALAQTGISYKDLGAVAATVGPGSFTGIRVGLAAARGICFAAGIDGLGFTTLETIAFAARDKAACIAAVLNAGKGEHYYQAFDVSPWHSRFEPRVGVPEIPDSALTAGQEYLRADALAELAATRTDSALSLQPFYIRPPDAKTMAERQLAT